MAKRNKEPQASVQQLMASTAMRFHARMATINSDVSRLPIEPIAWQMIVDELRDALDEAEAITHTMKDLYGKVRR